MSVPENSRTTHLIASLRELGWLREVLAETCGPKNSEEKETRE